MGRIALSAVDSTNAEAFRRAPHLAGPAWILAAEQTAGRGRRARPWASPRGNFYATHVMQPPEAAPIVALRSFVAALALYDALSLATGSPQGIALKWPNDVLLSGGKVAGILLECQTTGSNTGAAVQTLAIGIGVNLIGHPDPSQVEPGAIPPVSVLSQSGHRHTPEAFLTLLAVAYAEWEAIFKTQGFTPIRSAWLTRAARLGEQIRARTGQMDRTGIFDSIDDDGNLILRTTTGPIAIPAAEVFF